MAVIEVIPNEIRYWLSTSNMATKAADIVTSAMTGKTSAPGELRTITKQEACSLSYQMGFAVADYSRTDRAHPRPTSEVDQVILNKKRNVFVEKT